MGSFCSSVASRAALICLEIEQRESKMPTKAGLAEMIFPASAILAERSLATLNISASSPPRAGPM